MLKHEVQVAVTLFVVTTIVPPLLQAASAPWLVAPGKGIGPVRLGMTASQVLQTLGEPSSRPADDEWLYEIRHKIRVEFRA